MSHAEVAQPRAGDDVHWKSVMILGKPSLVKAMGAHFSKTTDPSYRFATSLLSRSSSALLSEEPTKLITRTCKSKITLVADKRTIWIQCIRIRAF